MGEVKILEQSETDETSPLPTTRWLTYVIEGMILLLGLVLVILLRIGVYEPAYIPSASMEPTLRAGDRLVIDHRNSLHGKWQRGDIILFEGDNNWGEGETLIKRIVGLPGETIEVSRGQLYIDGRPLHEEYLKERPIPEDVGGRTLQPGEYYVMGDNRNNSEDSRDNGPVSDAMIRGRAVMVFFPLGRFGKVPRPDYSK